MLLLEGYMLYSQREIIKATQLTVETLSSTQGVT